MIQIKKEEILKESQEYEDYCDNIYELTEDDIKEGKISKNGNCPKCRCYNIKKQGFHRKK